MTMIDKNNWCVATDKSHKRWSEFKELYSGITNGQWLFNCSFYGMRNNASEAAKEPFATLHTIDEVLDAYNEPEYKVGELYRFGDGRSTWTPPYPYEFTKDGLYWARINHDRILGYAHIRPVPKAKMTDKEFIEKVIELCDHFSSATSFCNEANNLIKQYKNDNS